MMVRTMKTRILRRMPILEIAGGVKVPLAAWDLGLVTPRMPRIKLMPITSWMMRRNLELILGFCIEALIHWMLVTWLVSEGM